MKLGINGRFYGAARVTGIQRFAREITKRLVAHDDCVLFLPRGVRHADGIPPGVPVVAGRLAGHLWEQLELPRAARRAGCDVTLHLASTAPALGGPHVVGVHDVTPLTHPEWFRLPFAWWYRLALGVPARRAARVFTVSEWSRREAARVLDLDVGDVGVVMQGLEPFGEPAPGDAVEAVRRLHGLPERYLLATGAGDPRKNLAFLIDMIGGWRPSSPAPTLVVAGAPNPRVHSARDPANGRGQDAIRFVGFVSDEQLRALYTGAAVFCYPSWSEGFGRPPLEAMACGTPVVTSEYGPAREVLGEAAAVLPLERDRWQSEIEMMLGDEAERRRRVEQGRRTSARWTWSDGADQVLSICRDVVAGRVAE